MLGYWDDYAVILPSGQVALIGLTHLNATRWEVFLPPSGNRRRDIIATGKFFRESWLEPSVYCDRRCISQMVPYDPNSSCMDVCRRLEASESRPKEIDRAVGGSTRLVGDYDERPIGEY